MESGVCINEKELTIGILYICTGRYRVFWPGFYKTMNKYFFPESQRKIFLFSDNPLEYFIESAEITDSSDIVYTHIENKPWPFVTLLRYQLFVEHSDKWSGCDYIFFINGDYNFYQRIGKEILPSSDECGLVVAEHQKSLDLPPEEYPYERNPSSQAYIPVGVGKHYFAGGFNGGKTEDFLKLCKEIDNATQTDLDNGIIAIWHDESQLNARLLHRNVKVLPPWYVWPSFWNKRKNRHLVVAGPVDKLQYGGYDWLRGATDKKLKSKFLRRLPRYIIMLCFALVLILLCYYLLI